MKSVFLNRRQSFANFNKIQKQIKVKKRYDRVIQMSKGTMKIYVLKITSFGELERDLVLLVGVGPEPGRLFPEWSEARSDSEADLGRLYSCRNT